ncbi:GPW/gp25 family protein [Fibrobacter sp.]|uniref:GPW/gp25 family protein n=1 Tax=Fibrobacter sp. TaxID=35828 RepID=UPI00386A39EF
MSSLTFLGRGWKFPLKFENGAIAMSEAEEDVDESLRILLGTYPGERLMRPDYGCRLRDYCFRNYEESTIVQLDEEIRNAIDNFEPRVTVENTDYKMDEVNDVLQIIVDYKVIATNSRRNLVYPFYINEGTDISI